MRGSRWLAVAVVATMSSTPIAGHAAGRLPSAIGNETVRGIAVSPLYLDTGLVVAMSVAVSCQRGQTDCIHIWISHDGGHTWQKPAVKGWDHGIPTVAVAAGGREELVAPGAAGVQVSDDYGDTWHDAGPSGTPSPLPTYARDGAIAVAAGTAQDHLVTRQGVRNVRGSGGALADMSFAFAPTYPSAALHSPVLLSGVDAKASQYVVERCDASLSCAHPVTLGPANSMGGPVQLQLSSDYADDGTVFGSAMLLGIVKSSDGGGSFVPRPVGATGASVTEVTALAVSPEYRETGPDRRVVAAVMQLSGSGKDEKITGGVYASADGATTWKTLGSPGAFDNGASAVAMAPDGRVFGGYVADGADAGLLCIDGGATTWETSCPPVGHYHASSSGETVGGGAACAAGSCASASRDHGAVSASGGSNGEAGRATPGAGAADAMKGAGAVVSGGAGGGRSMVAAAVFALLAASLGVVAALRRRRSGVRRG